MTLLKQRVKFSEIVELVFAFTVGGIFSVGLKNILSQFIPYSWGIRDDTGSYMSLSSVISVLSAIVVMYLVYVGYRYTMGKIEPEKDDDEKEKL